MALLVAWVFSPFLFCSSFSLSSMAGAKSSASGGATTDGLAVRRLAALRCDARCSTVCSTMAANGESTRWHALLPVPVWHCVAEAHLVRIEHPNRLVPVTPSRQWRCSSGVKENQNENTERNSFS
uniref:Secreted protein n=1 Tax=Oryza glumipatula TaxID=40148 RepID=A0A0E0BL30_9ORYZ